MVQKLIMVKNKSYLVISAGRSDYFRYLPIIEGLQNSKKAKVFLYTCQSYNNNFFGNLKKEVGKKFHLINNRVCNKNVFLGDEPDDIVQNFIIDFEFLSLYIKKNKPDFILIMGDRYEMLLAPILSIPHNIPLIHFFGGAITEGSTDELSRHALTKMSHFHFVLTDKYKKRLEQLGEERWRIKTIGMPNLKNIINLRSNIITLKKKFGFNFSKPFMLVTFHPVTVEINSLNYQINSLIKAIKQSKINAVITYPNSDIKFSVIVKKLKKNLKDKKKYIFIKNLGEENYFTLMKEACLMLGNSSSGIVESASFKLPVVNIGTRQDGKIKPSNIINTDYKLKNILKAIRHCRKKSFLNKINNLRNPYKSRLSPKKIVNIILNLKANDKLLRKKFIDLKL